MTASQPRVRRDEGMMALEMAILAPLVIVMLLLVVAFGRVTHSRAMIDQAAAAAARAASLSRTPGEAVVAARTTATSTLADAGLSCAGSDVSLDASGFGPGGQVTAEVTCIVDLSQMVLAGVPGRMSMTASSTSPIETYRDLGGNP